MEMKKCFKCKIEKPISEFNKHSNTKDKLSSYCKICNVQNKLFWQQTNKVYYNKHRKEKRANDDSYRLANNLRCRLWHALKRQLANKISWNRRTSWLFFQRIQRLHRILDDSRNDLEIN